MTDNETGQGNGVNAWPEPGHDTGDGRGWQPVPHGGEYDAEATAFVQLPPEDGTDAPLAAPGHGYVPPMITPLQPDPAVAGTWALPEPHEQQAEPHAGQQAFPDPYGAYGHQAPHAAPHVPPHHEPHPQDTAAQAPHEQQGTGHWDFTAALGGADPAVPAVPEPQAAATGEWRIPLATGEGLDESGEFSTGLQAAAWDAAPATLPGGARAPWATDPEPGPEHAPRPAEDVQHGWAPTADAAAGARGGAPAPDTPAAEESAEHPPAGQAAAEPVTEEPAAEPPVEEPPVPAPHEAPADAYVPEVAEQDAYAAEEPAAFAPPLGDAGLPEAEPAPLTSSSGSAEHPGCSYVLRVNGSDRPVTDAWIGESLLYVLRERLGLAGAKDGCSQGECGACNVLVDGRLVASCLVPAATAAGSEVRTVEGLATDGEPSDVQRALAARGAVQCGFCIPGMAMTVHDLLQGNHAPTELETRQALSGNLCRCSGYRGVLEAVHEVVAGRVAAAEAAGDEARIPHQAPPGAGGAQLPQTNDGGMA